MKRLLLTLIATGLLTVAVLPGWGEPDPSPSGPDKLAVAKDAELKGDLARIHGSYAAAASFYTSALRVDRQNAVLYNKLGIAELQLHERGAARKHFVQALKYDPRYVSALNNLGALAFLDKKYKFAVTYLKQALALDEANASTHLNLAEAWMALGEVDRSMTEYARALELNADILTNSQEGIQAQVSTPEQRARVSFLIAKAYARRGNGEGALEYLRRARDGGFHELNRVYKEQEFAFLWEDPRLAKIVKR